MSNIGIVEGFFGPPWSHQARVDIADFLQKWGGDFYIYAPKRDAFLRKQWRDEWSQDYLTELALLRDAYQSRGLKFGVALSPFGLGSQLLEADQKHLENKFKQLAEFKIDYLGLFFDDMPSTDDLLEVQSKVVSLAMGYFPTGLIFCPSYYSYDPILDKVFGKRPDGYVEGIKSLIPPSVDVCWTGPKVISPEILQDHLIEVEQLLGRKPFIWENLYANDGPKNCNFLKLKYFTGRDTSITTQTAGLAFNLMNQPYLSQLLFLSSLGVIIQGLSPEASFAKSCHELLSSQLSRFMIKHRESFLNEGRDKLSEKQRELLLLELQTSSEAVAQEVAEWLMGKYVVGPECLTD